MTNDIRKRLQIIEWFATPEPRLASVMLGVALVVTLAGLALAIAGNFFGILTFVCGAGWTGCRWRYLRSHRNMYGTRPSVAQMEQWLDEDLTEMARKGLYRSGVSEVDLLTGKWHCAYRPVDWVSGYGPDQDSESWRANRGREVERQGLFLYACWHITAVVMAENKCSVFECDYNWITNFSANHTVTRFPAQNILRLRWSKFSENGVLSNSTKVVGQKLDVVLRGGESVSLLLPDAPCRSIRDEKIKFSAEKVISMIRDLSGSGKPMSRQTSSVISSWTSRA